MKTETIYLPDSIILVNTEAVIQELWEGWAYKHDVGGSTTIHKNGAETDNPTMHGVFKHHYTTNPWYKDARKVIAANPKLGDLPLLPLPEDEALKFADTIDKNIDEYSHGRWYGRIEGFNTAKQNCFTKEDMAEFANFVVKEEYKGNKTYTKDLLELYLAQKPKPQFIPEMETCTQCDENKVGLNCICHYKELQPKIVDGKLCGTWK